MDNEIIKYIVLNPIQFITAIIMLIYLLKGKHWHVLYAQCLLMFSYTAIQTIGLSEFLVGIIVGVMATWVCYILV